MTNGDRRARYNSSRVLIEASRILGEPQFPNAVLFLSGIELELLRNLTQYLHRSETFVDEYHDDYYLYPDAADMDDIDGIVAALEETLMGNPNTIWGYLDRLHSVEDDTITEGTGFFQNHDAVPAGEVWRVVGYNLWTNLDGSATIPFAILGGAACAMSTTMYPSANAYIVVAPFDLIMKEGDNLRVNWGGLVVGQRIISNLWGYKMDVPE